MLKKRAKELFEGLVGRRSGIIQSLSLIASEHNDPLLFHCGGRIANTHFNLKDYPGVSIGGCGYTPEESIIKAIGEGVERYCASSYIHDDLTLATFDELSEEAISPDLFACFSEMQYNADFFPFFIPTTSSRFRWLRGKNLISRKDCWSPAQTIYVPYIYDKDETPIVPALSTGLCCHDSYDKAALGGILEVIERDSFALTWLKNVVPPRIPDEYIYDKFRKYIPEDSRLQAFDLTSNIGIPVCFILGKSLGNDLYFVGGGCGLSIENALEKAFLEAIQGRVYVRMLVSEESDWQSDNTFSQVSDFQRHAQFYTRRPDLANDAFAFLSKSKINDIPEYKKINETFALTEVCEILSKNNLSPRIFDLSQEWMKELGLTVIRAVIPELMPLHGHHVLTFFNHPRLKNINKNMPGNMGFITGHWMNPYPHPYP